MAKLDELDPRWIVEFRPDATNVNNWHWVEKNAIEWSRQKITSLLTGAEVEDPAVGKCVVTEITTVEGEATANNRKGKLIFLIDLTIKGTWQGSRTDDATKYKGTFTIIDFDDVGASDLNMECAANLKDKENAHMLREVFRKKAEPVLLAQLQQYLEQLRTEYSQNIILPTAGNNKAKSQAPVNPQQRATTTTVTPTPTPPKPSGGVKIQTKTLEMTQTFHCTPDDLYRALTNKQHLEALCHGEAEVNTEVGGTFKLFGGHIHGEFVQLKPFKSVVQRWRMKSWPAAHYSEVTLTLEDKPEDGETILHVKQTGVPLDEFERTEDGWKQNIFEPMRDIFGFGARLR